MDEDSGIPIILLQEKEGSRILPVWIGPFEASAIIIEMEQVKPPRPMTHDLMAEMFFRHKFRMKEVLIHRSFEKKYHASMTYRERFKHHTVDIRPSDGLALAVRLGAPIYATEEVFEKQSRQPNFFEGWESPPQDFLFLNSANSGPGTKPVH